MTEVMELNDADRALKARHRAMWALGDYDAVATHVIPALGPVLVGGTGINPGDRVLDVAAGSGNASLTVDAFSGPDDFLAYFKRNYGPTITLYKSLADQPERAAALDQELVDLAGRFGFADGATTIDWEFLHFTATRA
jgi:hypothetical protein